MRNLRAIGAYSVRMTTPPVLEPVTTAEAKLHLRVDHSTEDGLIDRLIVTARQHCEDVSRRAFITRTYTALLDDWPASPFTLPYPPLISVGSIKYTENNVAQATFASSNYFVDAQREPGRVVLKTSSEWPNVTLQDIQGVEIVYTAGYGPSPSDVPERYKAAILLMVAHLYEHREAVSVGESGVVMPMALDALLLTDRGGW